MSSNKIMKKVTNLYEPLYGIPVPYLGYLIIPLSILITRMKMNEESRIKLSVTTENSRLN